MSRPSLLSRAFKRFTHSAGVGRGKMIHLESGKQTIKLPLRDVLYIEAAANYSDIVMVSGRRRVRGSLKILQANFEGAGLPLIRIHRSFLVAPGAVLTVSETRAKDLRLLLTDGTVLLASRRYRDNFKTTFKTT